jgi:hypothetical protein
MDVEGVTARSEELSLNNYLHNSHDSPWDLLLGHSIASLHDPIIFCRLLASDIAPPGIYRDSSLPKCSCRENGRVSFRIGASTSKNSPSKDVADSFSQNLPHRCLRGQRSGANSPRAMRFVEPTLGKRTRTITVLWPEQQQ